LDDIFMKDNLNANLEKENAPKGSEYTVCMKVNIKSNKKGNKGILHGNSQIIKDGLELYKKKDLVSREEIYITEKMEKEVLFLYL
jgi:hypothetical protein